jgi:hypothetical protein
MRRHIAGWRTAALSLGTLGLGILSLSACAQPVGSVGAGSSAPTAAPSESPSSPAPSSPVPAPTASLPAPSGSMTPPIIIRPPNPTASGKQVSLSGQIYSGAEPSCLLLKQGTVQYLLLASDSMKLRAGMRAVVTGHVVHGIMTHCQQGVPFQVTNIDAMTP